MVAAVGLSVGSLIAAVGIATTAATQINADIAASTLDLVSLTVVPEPGGPPVTLPDDASDRLEAVTMVEAAGARLNVSEIASVLVTRTADPRAAQIRSSVPVVGVTSGYLRTARAVDSDHLWMLDSPDLRVAYVGVTAAADLGIPVTADPGGLRVWVDGVAHDVVGFIEPGGPASLERAVAIPYAQAVAYTGTDAEATLLARTEPGAGAQIARVAATAVRPDAPQRLEVSPVVSVESLRRGVNTQLDRLAAWTGSILLALTVLLIANSMVVAVTARTAEIGLRRALGTPARGIAAVFLTEGAFVGALGGLVGAAVASVTVVVTGLINRWDVVLEPWMVAAGPVLGLVVGLVASVYPALRASRISPALALRAD
ncbi:ABC transporter permease [Antribacter gilvus]|uniref:ABC transporter permease n=1 Tax=Antribacter gilvus TaxID=2304675 RepID=UPI0013DF38B1|nr:ABC transporter permease [Antribacter gilvus]